MTSLSFHDYDPILRGHRFVVLTDDEPRVEHYERSAHDEGWSSTHIVWELLPGGLVTCTLDSDGVDCDGRLYKSDVYVCRVGALASLAVKGLPFLQPTWERSTGRQRDYSAEAAGY